MKKIVSTVLAVGLMAATVISVSAANTSQIIHDPFGQLYNIEVGTTVGEVKAEMENRGLPISNVRGNGVLVSDAQVVHTGFSAGIQSKVSTVTLVVAGDINKDGKVDEDDLDLISQCLTYMSGGGRDIDFFDYIAFRAADVDMDGSISIADTMEVIKIMNRHS